MNFQSEIGFYLPGKPFCGIFFSAIFLFKFTKLKENFLNERSKFGTEINLVSRTEINLFMTMDLNDTIKTKPPNKTGTEGAISDTRYFLSAVLIKNASVGPVQWPFYQILSINQMGVIAEKRIKSYKAISRRIENYF